MALSEVVMQELAKQGLLAVSGALLLTVILIALFVFMALIVLLVLGFDMNLLMFKLFRAVKGIYLARVHADDTVDFSFRSKWDFAQNEMDFNSKGKDLTEKKPFRLDLKLAKRHRLYGIPVVLAVEGQPVNSDWKLGIKETEASQLNAVSKMRAHALGVLEGMLANMWDHRWVMIAAIAAIIAIIVAGISVYYGMQAADSIKGIQGALTSLNSSVVAVQHAVNASGSGFVAPSGG